MAVAGDLNPAAQYRTYNLCLHTETQSQYNAMHPVSRCRLPPVFDYVEHCNKEAYCNLISSSLNLIQVILAQGCKIGFGRKTSTDTKEKSPCLIK